MLWPDVTELKNFYASPLGQLATQSLRRAIQRIWPEAAKGESILGIGYALPCLRPLLKQADVVCAVMPAGQGVIHWPKGQPNLTLLSYEHYLPLRSESQNRIIVLHALEHSQPLQKLMEELNRVLTPSGRMIVITPNRRSLWARAENTPFAHGQPYSLSQLKQLLNQQYFHVTQSSEALFFFPSCSRSLLKFAPLLEKFGRRFFPHFGGALVVEVEKRKPAKIKGTPVRSYLPAGKPVAGNIS